MEAREGFSPKRAAALPGLKRGHGPHNKIIHSGQLQVNATSGFLSFFLPMGDQRGQKRRRRWLLDRFAPLHIYRLHQQTGLSDFSRSAQDAVSADRHLLWTWLWL